MKLDPTFFRIMLDQMDPREMAQHSAINHHANGLDYLCLHRSDRLTVKMYLMEEPSNPNNGFLVNPHSHRYAFGSIVLAGSVEHVRFQEIDGAGYERFEYRAEDGALRPAGICGLSQRWEHHSSGECYFVQPDEIHTLITVAMFGPVLIGLVQFADIKASSELYLPTTDFGALKHPNTRKPTVAETEALRKRCECLMLKEAA